MSTAVAEKPKTEPTNGQNLPALAPSRLPYHPSIEKSFGISPQLWRALVESIFPFAQTVEAVLLALSYCKARNLDVFKRPCHIVPIWSKDLNRLVDTIWPGIGELRTTAARTGEYAGRDDALIGPVIKAKVGNTLLEYPEWVQVTVYRLVQGQRCQFVGPRVRYMEAYATASRNSDDPNEMWRNRPFGQLEKCAEAAALRAAFPEEIGGDYIPEEVERQNGRFQTIQTTATQVIPAGQTKAQALTEQLRGRLENKPAETLPVQTVQQREMEPIARQETSDAPPAQEHQPAQPGPGSEGPTLEQEIAGKISKAISITCDVEGFMNLEGEIGLIKDDDLRVKLYGEVKGRKEHLGLTRGGNGKKAQSLPGTN